MFPGSKPLKTQAKLSIRAAAPSAVLVTLVFLLLTDVLSQLIYLFTSEFTLVDLIYGQESSTLISLFLTILMTLFTTVMQIGYWNWALDISRNRETGFGTLLNGFGMLGRIILMKVFVFTRILGWAFLMAFGYAILIAMFSFSALMVSGLTSVLYLSITVMILRFELAPLLLCDYPDAGAAAAVHRSAQMMRGHVWDYIKLHLSLWHWYLLIFMIQVCANFLFLSPSLDTISAAFSSGGMEQLTTQIDVILTSAAPALVTSILILPANLFFLPLRHVAVANFYRSLSGEGAAEQSFDSPF